MRVRNIVASVLMLAITATAGNQLPGGTPPNEWNGTNSQGDVEVRVKTSTGNAITFTRIKTGPDGVKIISSMNCAWDSTDNKYHTPQGGPSSSTMSSTATPRPTTTRTRGQVGKWRRDW